MTLKSKNEIEKMRRANLIVFEVLEALESACKPGVSTLDLDRIAEEGAKRRGAAPVFKGYMGYPAHLCTSVNSVVVHGIPRKDEILKEGDIVGLDFGVVFDGFVGDSARTVAIGKATAESERLMKVTRESLDCGIEACRAGGRVSDIGGAVQRHVEANGYSVVRDFVGHGIGRKMHEDPQVPNYFDARNGLRLREGLVVAIEPMVNAGGWEVDRLNDGWTVVTKDGSLSAHFEHSVAITDKGPYVLSQP